MNRILCVDDDPQVLRALATNLRARHYEVDLADTGASERCTPQPRTDPTRSSSTSGCPTCRASR